MTSINEQLITTRAQIDRNVPKEVGQALDKAIRDLSNHDLTNVIRIGERLPEFRLNDATGKEQSSTALLKTGPLIITFYRGEWCPYCNVATAAWQKYLAEIKAKGAQLVAITPELPNNVLSLTEKHKLEYPVLTDLHNAYARELGIVWKQPESLRPAFKTIGIDVAKSNGDDSFEVPLPATLLVDRQGIIRNAFIEPDYTKRVEPATVLDWIDAL